MKNKLKLQHSNEKSIKIETNTSSETSRASNHNVQTDQTAQISPIESARRDINGDCHLIDVCNQMVSSDDNELSLLGLESSSFIETDCHVNSQSNKERFVIKLRLSRKLNKTRPYCIRTNKSLLTVKCYNKNFLFFNPNLALNCLKFVLKAMYRTNDLCKQIVLNLIVIFIVI